MIAAFRAILLDAAAVATAAGDRVYPNVKPANERRVCIVLTSVADVPDYHMEGASNFSTGVMQLDIWAPTYAAAAALADAAAAALEAFAGIKAGKSIGWIEITSRNDILPDIEEGQQAPSEYGISIEADQISLRPATLK